MELSKLDQLFKELEIRLESQDSYGEQGSTARQALRYEQLAVWAVREFEARNPGVEGVPLWSDEDLANHRARERVKAGRKLKGGIRYAGYAKLDCPHAVPINSLYWLERRVILTESVGAFAFKFDHSDGQHEVVFVHTRYSDECCDHVSVAVVPATMIQAWAAFQKLMVRAANRLERGQRVYIVGGTTNSFKPTVDWDQVILDEKVKADIRSDVTSFFSKGVEVYKQLGLPPFRKLLLVGPPGTGKTTLTASLAKIILEQNGVVVYVSAADEHGASFGKVQQALNVIASQQHPVLMILEEIDAYLNEKDKSQILNVLDGLESPNNPRGALLLATTNYPEVIDERIAKRPGRVDRIIYIPPINDLSLAERMLKRYMGNQWQDDHRGIAPDLIGQTGAFVREVAIYARLLAANEGATFVTLPQLEQSVKSLSTQLSSGHNLQPRRSVGFGAGSD